MYFTAESKSNLIRIIFPFYVLSIEAIGFFFFLL